MLETRKGTVSNLPEKAVYGATSPVREVGLSGAPDENHHRGARTQFAADEIKPLGLVWINSSYPVVAAGLARILEGPAWVHLGPEAPTNMPSSAIFDTGGVKNLSEGVRRIQELNPGIAILVFGLHIDLPLVKAALQAGARGFIHARMQPDQIARAVEVTTKGELAAPRQLLEYLLAHEESVGLDALGSRQREILELLAEGLTNAEIAQRLYLSESTIKQHLRHTYKLLGVKNRTEAVKLFRREDAPRR